ncbi:MAG: tRNA (adenine(22)-N(1))-methyltransferase [Bacillota bacterium]|uniref:tRNA (adenine(22)-N(1))-methyltransferase n=1 Tax=Thermanaerosceptrum fracticalcis TaxID=1712410 RepID=UPI000554B171|nr:class I SAM-dependent methyltransferase [Thermanaerosceptrum fracticalcis]
MLNLSQRLLALARLVPQGSRVADIGTDHAFLPCYLVKEGIASFVIGVDVHEGPYQAACRTVRAYNVAEQVEIRRGDGLTALMPGEVDVVIIAGMGGSTGRDILENSPQVVEKLKKMIFQPMNGADVVRRWLSEHNWVITGEDIIYEDKRLFVVIAAEKGERTALTEEEIHYGPLLIKMRHPLLQEVLQKDIEAMQEILKQLAKSQNQESRVKVNEFTRKIHMAKGLQEWLFAAKQ